MSAHLIARLTIERDEARGAVRKLVAERRDFTSRLGFGDGITEPDATLAQIVDPVEEALNAMRDHFKCPNVCEGCGERLAATNCEHCHGSGCDARTALGAYSECEWCAGAGKVHPGCAERSYADLVSDRDHALSIIGRIGALAQAQAIAARALGLGVHERNWLDVLAIVEGHGAS